MKYPLLFSVITLLCTSSISAYGQQLLHQPNRFSAPVPAAAPILSRLDDPFFQIVIKATPQPNSLAGMIATLTDGGLANLSSFVVGEKIGRPEHSTPQCGAQVHRLVLSFGGTHAASGRPLDGNLFVSTFLSPSGPAGAIEVMAWDQTHGTYNYYKFESGSWRLRNISDELSTESAAHLSGGCLACHVNGGPVMKEFTFPWNNWHSISIAFVANYLRAGTPNAWPAATGPILNGRLAGAQSLESIIESSLKRFTRSLVETQIQTATDGSVSVSGLPNLLDSLFKPTELNLGSSVTKSGLDGGGLTQSPSGSIVIPDSFFINIAQMRDIEIPTLESLSAITEVFTPGTLGLSLAEYETLLREFNIDTQCLPGRDTLFAWFGPESSEFDRRMVERLTRLDVIDRNFAAAALAIDVGTPLFSDERASLLAHIPSQISAPNKEQLANRLTATVIASIETKSEADRSPAERDFLTLLQGGNAVGELDNRVRTHRDNIRTALDPADAPRRQATLRSLFQKLIDNRNAFRNAPISGPLAEFRGLFPTPN